MSDGDNLVPWLASVHLNWVKSTTQILLYQQTIFGGSVIILCQLVSHVPPLHIP